MTCREVGWQPLSAIECNPHFFAPSGKGTKVAIRLKGGAVFLHIPKTGGSWIERVLAECNLIDEKFGHKHANFDMALNRERFQTSRRLLWYLMTREVLNKITRHEEKPTFTFCFVRHPLSWYESFWKYMNGRDWHDWGNENSKKNWHPNAVLNGLGSRDFNEFVMNVVNKRPGYVTELYFSYAKPGIDFIGKTENLKDDLLYILNLLELQFDAQFVRGFERVNVSKTPQSDLQWDEDVRNTVMRLELPALIHFEYLKKDELPALGISKEIPPYKKLHITS